MESLKRVLIFIVLYFCHGSALAAFSVGTSIQYTKTNDPGYKFTNEIEQFKPTSLNVGYVREFNKFTVGAYTNRILNKGLKRGVRSNGIDYVNETKVTYDMLQLGYRINRIIPNVFIANTKVDKKLFYKEYLVGRKINHIYAYGIGANYFVHEKATVGLTYIAPNAEVNMEGGLALSINYLF